MNQRPRPLLFNIPEDISGSRIRLRTFRPGDGRAVWDAIEENREHLRRWLAWEANHRSVEDSEEYVRRAQAAWIMRDDLPFGVWNKDDGLCLGGTGLHRIDWTVPRFEIGYWLRLSAEGHGFMTEAVSLLCNLVFDTLGAERVEIRCNAMNVRSAAIPRRLGFVEEAVLRRNGRNHVGEIHDTLIFSLVAEEFAELRSVASSPFNLSYSA